MSNIDQTSEPARTIAVERETSIEGQIVDVGFIGLGHMGAGMAANLLKAGHRVTVFNRTSAKTETLVSRGAKATVSIAENRFDSRATPLTHADFRSWPKADIDCTEQAIFLADRP